MSSGDKVAISISMSMSERLSANQRVLYVHVNHVLTGHNTDMGRTLMLMITS